GAAGPGRAPVFDNPAIRPGKVPKRSIAPAYPILQTQGIDPAVGLLGRGFPANRRVATAPGIQRQYRRAEIPSPPRIDKTDTSIAQPVDPRATGIVVGKAGGVCAMMVVTHPIG